MIEKEYLRENFLSNWLQKNMPDPSTGTRITDIDFVLTNANRKTIALIEKKTNNAEFPSWQKSIYVNVAESLRKNGFTVGAYIIKFEGTNFDNGKVYVNGIECSEEKLKKILSRYC